MALRDALLPEFDMETATARLMLERVPVADAGWKPHPKSTSLGALAVHVAALPGWTAATLAATELDLGSTPPPPPLTTVEALLSYFEANVAAGRAALAGAADADFGVPWTLRMGAQVIFTLPRAVVLRSYGFNHLVHHRAQLGVYLRLRGVPLPPSYGPTADSGM
jgi:uncharacterized damage-inducible protein DinB